MVNKIKTTHLSVAGHGTKAKHCKNREKRDREGKRIAVPVDTTRTKYQHTKQTLGNSRSRKKIDSPTHKCRKISTKVHTLRGGQSETVKRQRPRKMSEIHWH